MKRALILLGALALGCDDPDVSAKALDVLEHGFVAAEVICPDITFSPVGGGSPVAGWSVNAQKLADGACLIGNSGGIVRLYARSSAYAETCTMNPQQTPSQVTLAGGLLNYGYPTVTHTADIETFCTGFNLEAFGVE